MMNRKNSPLNKFLKKSDSSAILNDKIQEKLYTWFEDKGLLSDLKAHIRQKMISALKGCTFGVDSLHNRNSKSISPKLQAMNLLIADFLLHLQYHYTLSVFFTEVPMLSNLSEFSSYVTKLADKNFDHSSGLDPPPRIHKKDVEDILQALGFPSDSHMSIRTRRMYQFNREDKALLTCLIECLQSGSFGPNSIQRYQEKINDGTENELWPKEIRDVFMDSDLSFEQLEILQEHITRYYKNAVKKLRAEEEAKYRMKVSEVLQKEKETYGKLAETEKRLMEQQKIIKKEIAVREEQLKTLSAALRKQHDAIAERLLHLQDQSLKLSEKEETLRLEKEKETEKLQAKKSELLLKERELEEAYAKLAEEQKKIADEKKTLELTQKLISGSNALDCNDPQSSVKFLQQLSHQCSALTQKLAVIRNEREDTSVENLCTTPRALSSVENAMFEHHKELINETKAKLEQKINELMLKLEETKEKHFANLVPKNLEVESIDKNLADIVEEPANGFESSKLNLSKNESRSSEKVPLLVMNDLRGALKDASPIVCSSQRVLDDTENQSLSQAFGGKNKNENVDVNFNASRTSLLHRLNVERLLVNRLQEENTELKAQALLQNQQIIDLTIQTRDLESRLTNASNTVRVVTVNSDPVPLVPSRTTVSVVSPYSPVVATAAPFALARPRRQWFNRHVGSGEESTFPSVATPTTSARSRLRELRKKIPRRIVTPAGPSHSSSTETSSGIDALEETRRRLKKLEKESLAVNRMYQDYQFKKERNSQVFFQPTQTGSTNTQPIYCAESQKSPPPLITSSFRPYASFRPICSTLRPIITSMLPQSSYFNQNAATCGTELQFEIEKMGKIPNDLAHYKESGYLDKQDRLEPSLHDVTSQNCAVMKKLSSENATSRDLDECEYFDESPQYPNGKFRNYYRHWLDSHFRKPSANQTDSDSSRVSPLKQLFHLKQHKYKKSQVPVSESRSGDESDSKGRKSPKPFRVFNLSKTDRSKDSPQVIVLKNGIEASPCYAHPVVVEKSESLLSSSDLDDSLKFERLILQNQQNVAALRQKFENFQDFGHKVKPIENTAYFLNSKPVRNLKSRKDALMKNASLLSSEINLNNPDCKISGKSVESGAKIYEITSSLDINSNETPVKLGSPTAHNPNVNSNEKQSSASGKAGLKVLPAEHDEISPVLKTSSSQTSITTSESAAALKIKENYRRLSLYNRLNDYYEEIIDEMNASEEEKQNMLDIDQLLQPVVADSKNFQKSDTALKEESPKDLVKEHIDSNADFESSHPSGHPT